MSGVQALDFSFTDGARAVELAREAIESFVLYGQREQPGSMRDAFYTRTGALVRIESATGRRSLRGCAGGYDGTDQLGHAIVDAAIVAASEDSCGSEIEPAELPNIKISVCVVGNVLLTDDALSDLEVGRFGLAVDGRGQQGWMYPTIPIDHGWSPAECLDRTCRKAGLPGTAWEDDDVMVTLFEGVVFREREPEGSIEQL